MLFFDLKVFAGSLEEMGYEVKGRRVEDKVLSPQLGTHNLVPKFPDSSLLTQFVLSHAKLFTFS